jgi:hypothetical protein
LLVAVTLAIALLGQVLGGMAADKPEGGVAAPGLFGGHVPDQLTRLKHLDPYCFAALTPDWSDAADGSFNSVAVLVEDDGKSVCPNKNTPEADNYVSVIIIPIAPYDINLVWVYRLGGGSTGLQEYILVSVVERFVPVDDHHVSKQVLLIRRGLVPIRTRNDDDALRMARRWRSAMGGTILPYVPDQLGHLRRLDPFCFAFVAESYADAGTKPGTRIATLALEDGRQVCPTRKKPEDLKAVDVKFIALAPFGVNLVRLVQHFGMLANPPEYILVSLVEAAVPIQDDVVSHHVVLVRHASLPTGIQDDDEARQIAERWAAAMIQRP